MKRLTWNKQSHSLLTDGPSVAAWRAARALGWQRLITFILDTETGTLRAAGWHCIGEAGGGSWSRPSRPREDRAPTQGKLRWEAAC